MKRLHNQTPKRSILAAGAILAATSLALSGCSASTTEPSGPIVAEVDGDITWFSWGEYVAPGLVEGFEKEYGVKVTIEAADSSENMVQKLASGQAYDVVTGNSAYMQRMIEGKLLRPFDIEALENYENIAPYFQAPEYDSGEERYSVPYSGGPTGIIYRTDKVDGGGSWNQLWENASTASGHIYVLDQIEETIGMSLLRDGEELNSGDAAAVEKAVDNLLELKPALGGISTDTRTNVGNGDAWIHHSWSTDAFQLMTDSPFAGNLDFVMPEEGAPFGMNVLNIGANSKSPGTALLFIDYLLRPEVKVENVKYLGELTGSVSGDAEYNDIVAEFPVLQADEDFYDKAVWKRALTGERQSLWSEQWNRFKAS